MSRNTDPTPATVRLVRKRDQDSCLLCGRTDSLQTHHRRPRGMGGTRRADTNSACNLITLCLGCHANIESRREWALQEGLLVRQHQDPSQIAIQTKYGRVLLTADGRAVPVNEKGAPHGHLASAGI